MHRSHLFFLFSFSHFPYLCLFPIFVGMQSVRALRWPRVLHGTQVCSTVLGELPACRSFQRPFFLQHAVQKPTPCANCTFWTMTMTTKTRIRESPVHRSTRGLREKRLDNFWLLWHAATDTNFPNNIVTYERAIVAARRARNSNRSVKTTAHRKAVDKIATLKNKMGLDILCSDLSLTFSPDYDEICCTAKTETEKQKNDTDSRRLAVVQVQPDRSAAT